MGPKKKKTFVLFSHFHRKSVCSPNSLPFQTPQTETVKRSDLFRATIELPFFESSPKQAIQLRDECESLAPSTVVARQFAVCNNIVRICPTLKMFRVDLFYLGSLRCVFRI